MPTNATRDIGIESLSWSLSNKVPRSIKSGSRGKGTIQEGRLVSGYAAGEEMVSHVYSRNVLGNYLPALELLCSMPSLLCRF